MKILPSQGLDSWTANAKQTASSLGFSHYSVSLFSKYVFPINTCCLNGWLEWMNNSMRTWKRSILSYLWEKGRPHAKECHLLWEKVRLNQKLAKVEVFPGYRSTRAEASPTKESVAFPGTPRVSSVPGLVSIWKGQRRLERRQWEDHDDTDLLSSLDFILRRTGRHWIILNEVAQTQELHFTTTDVLVRGVS